MTALQKSGIMLTDKNYIKKCSCSVSLPGSPGKETSLLFVQCFNRVNQGALCYNLKPTVKAVNFYFILHLGGICHIIPTLD